MSHFFIQFPRVARVWRWGFLSISFLLVPIVLIACVSQTKLGVSTQPEWVVGNSQEYAATQYFVGKGRASALDVAAKNARNALLDSLPELSSQSSSALLDTLGQNAEVVDAWFDEESQLHFALVVVERAAAIQALQQQLANLNNQTQQFIRTSTQGVDPLSQIRATHEALATQPQRADLVLALQTLGDDVTADESVWSVIELQVHLKSLLSSIDVRPLASVNRQLDSAVVRGLDAAGYLSKRANPSFELKTSLQRSGMKWEQGWFTELGTLSVELLDSNQQVRAKAQWPLRVQTQERAMLDKELMGLVEGTLESEFANTVMSFVTETGD